MRRGSNYTPMGKKIFQLCDNQAELARILDLTQQSISGKLTGKIAITLKDLELLAKHYNVPMFFFLLPDEVTTELATSVETLVTGPAALKGLVEVATSLPEPFMRSLLGAAQALKPTAEFSGQGSHVRDQELAGAPAG